MNYLKLFILAICSVGSFAAEIGLTWDANPPSEAVTKYTIYQNGAAKLSVATNGASLTVPDGSTVTLFVTASNDAGESEPSESIVYTAPVVITAPKSPVIVSNSWVRQFSGNQGLWLVGLGWMPVTNATGYIVVSEQFSLSSTNSVLRTNFTTGTNIALSLNFGSYQVSVQSMNSAGVSPRDSFVYSPSVPGRPTGLRIIQ
jgi:hypothetical protein